LINALSALDNLEVAAGDPTTGVGILRQALEAPMRKIAENAGKNGDVIIQNVRRAQEEQGDYNIGYNVLTDTYENMITAGIIDPAKVTRGALENAASIAAMILTTEALITDIPEEEKPMPGGGPDMGGMGGGMGF
jgi:chaperonin GroEL